MDERRLTAWLITEDVLASDQVKHALEEQIRLQRQGTRLDILGVARRLSFLTDAQVLDVIERSGYKPALPSKAPVVIEEPGASDGNGNGRGHASDVAVAGAMDERRLTAWLITRGVLEADQVKIALTEQIRLARHGNKLDILDVARRLGYLTDAQLLDVIERSGYRREGPATPSPALPSTEGELDGSRDFGSGDLDGSADGLDASASGIGAAMRVEPAQPRAGWGGSARPDSEPERDEPRRRPGVRSDAASPRPAMDERRLTAWLITEGVLSADDIKRTLEEQIRLQRQGSKLDVLGVARKLGLLGDAKVLEVLERTGYKPVDDQAVGRQPEPTDIGPLDASASASSIGASDPSFQASGESALIPVTKLGDGAGSSAPPDPRRASGSAVRRRSRMRNNPAQLIAMLVAAPIAVLALLVVFNKIRRASYDDPQVAGRGRSGAGNPALKGSGSGPASAGSQRWVTELRSALDSVERTGVATDSDQSTIKSLLSTLASLPLDVAQAQVVERARRVLRELEAGSPQAKEARVEEAWKELARDFEEILWQCLDQPRSPIHLGAEGVRGVDLHAHLSGLLRDKASQGPDAIAGLVGSADLHPVLGVGGYDALIGEAERFPEEFRGSERWTRWQTIIPQFKELRDRAASYQRALRRAEFASEIGDHESARKAFQESQYAGTDPWFQAVLKWFAQPDVTAAFARRAKEIESGSGPEAGPVVPLPRRGRPEGGASAGPAAGGTQVTLTGDWKERFLTLERAWKKASEQEKPGVVSELARLGEETLQLAKRSFDRCKEIVSTYDAHKKPFESGTLSEVLRQHHAVYFEGAFAAASGPATYRELDDWCAARGYDAWRAKLRPYLRLVAAAENKAARAREAVRRQREQVAAKVDEFEGERLDQVAQGLSTVLDWMRRRKYAPDDTKQSLDALIARSVERAGNPVAGARLREELKLIDHAPTEDAAKLAVDYQKQLQGVIDECVGKSLKAVERCLAANEPGQAFDLFSYVLTLDPENDRAHKGLGHVKVDGKWLRRYDAQRLKDGYEWNARLGWVKSAEKARYDKGEYFDIQSGSWTTVDDINRRRSQWADHWVVRTEHFELHSSADLHKTAAVAARLEAFYLAMFRQYDLFFMGKGAGGAAAMIFGVGPEQKPLVVNFYRDEGQFRQHANPPTGWAAGFYSGGQHASFFYDMGSDYQGWTVLQHEVVHQILGETAGSGGGAPAWLAEGAAVYLEDAFFKDGVLTLGELKDHHRVATYAQMLRGGGPEHAFEDMLKFVTGADWDSGDIGKNYRGAGAVVYFLCHFDGGRYRSDFVEFLRQAYYGGNPSVEDYFGLPPRVLNALMKRFYDPKAEITPSAGAADKAADLDAAREALVALCGQKEPDLDQLTQAYAMLRGALAGAEQKSADKARDKAGKALVALRKRMIDRIEKAVRASSSGENRMKAYQELTRLRAEAVAIINDTSRYPEANHGAAGQPAVDEKVNALKAFWNQTPPALDEPANKAALELLDATDPWLDELALEGRKRGESAADLKRWIREQSGPAGLAMTDAEKQRLERDKKVREYNESRTDIREEIRAQVRVLNEYRDMLGIHALALEPRLCAAADKHSQYMQRTGQFDHVVNNPGRRTPSERCQAEGYTAPVGENIAMGYHSPEAVHNGWYNSSGHHRNMTSTSWWEIGVGREGSYWTQNFGMNKPQF